MVHTDLKVTIQCKINVVACFRFRAFDNFEDPSHTVHIHGLGTFLSLKFRLHGCLNTGLAHKIRQLIVRICLSEFLKLVVPDFSDVSDDRRKIDAVIVNTDRGFLNSDSF